MPFRIHHVITRMILGGAQENTLLSCEGLHRRGHEITLITGPAIGSEGELLSRAKSEGFRVIVLDDLRREVSPLADWRSYRALREVFRDEKPEVVHTHSSKAGILGRRAAWKENVPGVVHTIHGLPFHEYQSRFLHDFYRACERRAARWCHRIVCVGEVMKEKALSSGVGVPDQYSIAYSGMDVDAFIRKRDRKAARKRWGIPLDARVIGVLSRLAPLKGHQDLLDIAEDVHLFFVGDGELRGMLEREASLKNLALTVTGMIDPGDIPDALAAMDILVHPSYREGLPRAVVQGLLSGLPVVAFDCDGAREVLVNGETGFLVPPGRPEILQKAVREAFLSGGALAEEGRRRCERLFTTTRMIDLLEQVYEEILSKK